MPELDVLLLLNFNNQYCVYASKTAICTKVSRISERAASDSEVEVRERGVFILTTMIAFAHVVFVVYSVARGECLMTCVDWQLERADCVVDNEHDDVLDEG